MTSRFFFFVLFFGSDVGGGVVVVVWRHPEALLFSVCVLADYTLSLVLFLDIYIKWNWKNAIEFVVSNSYSSRNALRRRILSLSPENKRDAFLVVVVVIDDDDDFVVFKGRFFFDTHIRCGRLRRPTELMSSSCSRVLLPTTTALEDHHNVVSFGGGGFGERSEGGRRRDETKRTTWTTRRYYISFRVESVWGFFPKESSSFLSSILLKIHFA